MSMLSSALSYSKLQDNEIAWKLLRAKNAPTVIAILDEHLGGKVRRLLVSEFVSLVEVDLDELRARGNFELTRSAQAYCDQWRLDGYLIRRPVEQTRQETYELSSGALAAISFVKRLVQPHRTATQSRLNTIIRQINDLATATDRNEEHRRRLLLEEREKIDAQLKLLDEGNLEILDGVQALEQTRDILSLAQEIPSDFVHVRDDFENINKSLHATIINYEDGHADVLENIFNGVDQISQSPAGRSFKGFYSLLRDVGLTESLQDDIDFILDSDYSSDLDAQERRFMRNLIKTFLDQSQEVNQVMTSFARGLRRFVQNQDYQKDRVLKRHIDQALIKAHEVIEEFPVNKRLNISLDLSSVQIQPISRYQLMNPNESRTSFNEELGLEETQVMSLEELRALARETEIDFHELSHSVNECFRQKQHVEGGLSIARVLQEFPASQGVASVVGLLVLALEHGKKTGNTEAVTWKNKRNNQCRAHIEQWEFQREVEL